jgi:uncharacterized protein (TIGR02594 family)
MSYLPAPLPAAYRWLGEIGPLPRIVATALRDFGLKEKIGTENNPIILDWAEEIGGDVARVYKADSIPWCGLAMAHWAIEARKLPFPSSALWAKSWAQFGTKVAERNGNGPLIFPAGMAASLGDVLVFARNGGGHVGLYVAEDAIAYHVLGGNQGDAVSIVPISKGRCIAVRRPPFATAMPATARPFRIGGGGKLSTNEA